MAFKKNRSVKVYERCGYNYRPTPTIMLKGQWLKELGFEKETKILQKKFEEEKKRLHAQFVAERKAGYGVVAEPGLEV